MGPRFYSVCDVQAAQGDGSRVVGTGGPELLYKQLYGLGYIVTKLYEKSLEVSEGLPLSRLTKQDTQLE